MQVLANNAGNAKRRVLYLHSIPQMVGIEDDEPDLCWMSIAIKAIKGKNQYKKQINGETTAQQT